MTETARSQSPELDQALREAEGPGLDAATLDRLFEGVSAGVREADEAPAAKLRAMSTPTRRTVLYVLSLLAIGAAIGMGLRPVEGGASMLRFVAEVGALAALLVGCLQFATRPFHAPPARPWVVPSLVATAGAVLVGIAMLPPAAGLHEHGDKPCMFVGLLFGIPAFILARLIDRGSRGSAILAATGAGLVGNVALHMHCPIGGTAHLLTGHASLLPLFLGIAAVTYAVERSLRSGD